MYSWPAKRIPFLSDRQTGRQTDGRRESFMISVWGPPGGSRRIGSHHGHLLYLTQHLPSGSPIYTVVSSVCVTQRHGGPSNTCLSLINSKNVNQRVKDMQAVEQLACSVSWRKTQRWVVTAWVSGTSHVLTTRNKTLPGINHSFSLATITVTQLVHTTLQLICCCLISVWQFIYSIYANVCEWVPVYTTEVHYVLVLMLLTWLLFYRIPL